MSTLQGNDTIDVNVGDTVSTALFVDGGQPTTVNKGNDQLNLFDKSVGRKGVYSKFLAAAPLAQGQLCLRSRQPERRRARTTSKQKGRRGNDQSVMAPKHLHGCTAD